MNQPYPDYFPDRFPSSPTVLTGLWEKYSETRPGRWVWTLRNSDAIIVLGCFTVLVAFSQSRSWTILRYLILLRKRSVRLDDNGVSDDALEDISQGRAITDVLPFVEYHTHRLRTRIIETCTSRISQERHSRPGTPDCSVISPLFGIVAFLNIALFIFLSVAMPVLLSQGATGSALTCMFAEHTCHNNTLAYEISHRGITPNEMRVNSRSRITINHRLTCAPIFLDTFLHLKNGSGSETVISVAVRDRFFEVADRKLGITLRTINNPNLTTNEDLSTRMRGERWPYDLTILPQFSALDTFTGRGPPGGPNLTTFGAYPTEEVVDEKLQSLKGKIFLAVHRAGPAVYTYTNDDPLFSSHVPHKILLGPTYYLPDQEATALGCLESFQYCVAASHFCTSWGTLSERLDEVEEELKKEQDISTIEDVWVSRMLTEELSVHEYFLQRTPWMFHNKNVPFTLPDPLEVKWEGHPMGQTLTTDWRGEVKEWLLKGIEKTMLQVQHGALIDIKRKYYNAPFYQNTLAGHETLCDRVLFAHMSYTNIHFGVENSLSDVERTIMAPKASIS
ncbi:hypothetical protein GLAREA_05857 [Glarea lozoyensis ATCC 20868]|uniref:Uncharacterized protein n=1 Tax=Glarea lozoyensis (strain ATCC 20868 / MF5171) TaxID=1116229 RepID=S3D4Z8_GLAL2|nr:uncharacterized protein GLAREA_05857 [Glarea lozoyensis ATCC 20868]EPE32845.1 hypothetical protein GLAREA_05857 [Glarea lozoyensis ATCC 20868]